MSNQNPEERLRLLLATFDELLDLDDAAREVQLATLRTRDPELAADLATMLQSGDATGALELESSLGSRPAEEESASGVAPGSEVGPYRIVRKLGRGGMGEVYLATRRHHGFDQAVALKLLRRDFLAASSIQRFHRECRIQARLSHPAIVPLLDAGIASDGRPFLALQFVDGVPVTDYADAQRLSLPARLQLVVRCCRAVEFAHGQLVIHRDIKPSNILVADDGAVRLLDFGIAKLLDDEDEVDLTRQTPAPMTPERAAPEQLRGEPTSTATDVWGLGVLLFELATGRLPFDLRSRTPSEIERAILERGPTRPARALPQGTGESETATREAIARARSTTVRRLLRDLSGDLEVVVGRALAPDPERRYPSAAALADDIERLVSGRPIAARPDSLGYRTIRFVGRHRVAVASALLAGAGLVALSVSVVVQSARAVRERDRATVLEGRSKAVVELLTELFGATAPNRGAGVDEISIDELLRQGEAKAESLVDTPAIQQNMFATLGRIRLERSELPRGRALLERARSIADASAVDLLEPERLALELEYARALGRMDLGTEARAVLEPLVSGLESRGREGAADLAEALSQLALVVPAADGQPLAERALAIRRVLDPPRPVEVAASLDTLGNLEFRSGGYDRARAYWKEALPLLERELGEEDLRTLSTLNNLTVVSDDPVEQLTLMRRLITIHERLLGPDSGPVANEKNNLGVALALLGRYEEADTALRDSYRTRVLVLGAGHRETVRTLRNVARIAELRGRYPEALQLFDQVLAGLPATGIPEEQWSVFEAQRAAVVWRSGDRARGRRDMTDALRHLRAGFPAGHEEIAAALIVASRMAARDGELEPALASCREALAAREATQPPGSPRLAEARAELGRLLTLRGEGEEGRALLEAALPTLESWGLLHPDDRSALERARKT